MAWGKSLPTTHRLLMCSACIGLIDGRKCLDVHIVLFALLKMKAYYQERKSFSAVSVGVFVPVMLYMLCTGRCSYSVR